MFAAQMQYPTRDKEAAERSLQRREDANIKGPAHSGTAGKSGVEATTTTTPQTTLSKSHTPPTTQKNSKEFERGADRAYEEVCKTPPRTVFPSLIIMKEFEKLEFEEDAK